MPSQNPLEATNLPAPRPRAADAKPNPMLRHAQIWKHANQQTPDALHAHVAQMDYGLPILGALAADPNVKPKDVIKALAGAAADGEMTPSKAVASLSDMPADPDKLGPWLKERYADALSATVHAKAALMRQGMMAPHPSIAPAPASAPPTVPPGATVQ